MAKNYKLQSKKKIEQSKKPDKYFYQTGGLFHRYTCTRFANIAIIIGESLSLVLTTIFALVLGIFGSIIMGNEYGEALVITETMNENAIKLVNDITSLIVPANTLWLISSILYIVGTFVLIFGFSRIASLIHGSATVMTIVSYSLTMSAHNLMGSERSPAAIMLPCIFITVISIIIMMLVYIPKWLDKKNERDYAPAPSILSDKED